MYKLANYIRCLRIQKGLNQENMAYDLGISVTAYSKIERGLTNISFSRLKQIAECLDVTMTSLVDYYENGDEDLYRNSERVKSNYVPAAEYSETTVFFMQTRIIDLEENMRILKQALMDMRAVLQKKEM